MSTVERTKINQLLTSQPRGAVMLSSWLSAQGYSSDLQKRYRKSGWLESIGKGAMIRAGAQVGYEGALYALQTQSGMSIHPGGRSALAMLGKAHYLEMGRSKVTLFSGHNEKPPVWFQNHDWGTAFDCYQSAFLPPYLGLTDVDVGAFKIKVSGSVRAIMECLYLAPEKQELAECYELMEGLTNLRPDHVQKLLEACNSIKVKRLFMVLAEKAGHSWVEYIDLKKVDFGKGKRSIVKDGVYVSKYQITVPKEWGAHDKADL
ncbi:MAG: type IV toxin-antitoxin system AbiEi family antitoxin [Alphaproteobacteria bacterium]|nr:type IV toxin-antitoxin system AbiEi family antitoxin [Alphaproteobacteria bacterium]